MSSPRPEQQDKTCLVNLINEYFISFSRAEFSFTSQTLYTNTELYIKTSDFLVKFYYKMIPEHIIFIYIFFINYAIVVGQINLRINSGPLHEDIALITALNGIFIHGVLCLVIYIDVLQNYFQNKFSSQNSTQKFELKIL